ncbi:MAG TPA: phosphatase PAP2 family protein, partial [Myxococcota bacterium]
GPALIGPRFDPGDPDLQLLFDPRLDDVIGRPFTNEKVSNGALTIGAFSVIALTSLADFFTADDLHHTHAVALGAVETLAGTVLVVEALKPLVGRLRPDYRDRFVHAACGGTIAVPAGLDCAGVDNSFTVDADDLRDGQKSFASGHAATSFAMATYASWWLGTKLVWAKDAPAWGPAVGSLGIGSLMSVAGFVSASRLSDNRHHPEDVVVGAALGAGIASALWFTHVDLDGRARRRGAADDDAVSVEVAPALGMGSTGTGTGLALVATLP